MSLYHTYRKAFVTVLVCLALGCFSAKAQYRLHINFVDKDSSFTWQQLQLQTSFTDLVACAGYVNNLPAMLGSKGYPTASVDSFWIDSTSTHVNLFLGKQYHWIKLQPDNIDARALTESGYIEKDFSGRLINMQQLQVVKQRLANYYEKNGRPFAEIYLDSIRLDDDRIDALLRVKPGPLYHIDSIRLYGKAKISKSFLKHYLDLPKGSVYSRQKLEQVDKKILDLPYVEAVQPSNITMLGSGAILNLYLTPKRSSQFNFLVGFLPSATDAGKLQITGDVNLNLKNALNTGETILLNWQQLQPKSPRLNLGYAQPYIFHSSFGVDFAFDLFKKDSSFLQVNAQLGLQYILSANQSGKLFVQWQNSFLLAEGVDTSLVIATKKLPPNIDVNAVNVGIDYDWNNTDYKLNPLSGNEVRIITSVGLKNIKRNNDILNIKDPSFNYASLYDSVKAKSYQFRARLSAAHYFRTGKQSTFKAALNAGYYTSPNIFRNELFQIGGYKLLRGFNEESIYATQYGVATAEYRYRLGLNSNLFGFVDAGWAKNQYQDVNVKNTFIGTGLGLLFETKFGLLNISYAIGKRDDVKFNLRESSKIHFGYINYF